MSPIRRLAHSPFRPLAGAPIRPFALSPTRHFAPSPIGIDTEQSLNTLERLHENGCILG
jgi:hypothetical protein